jgi:RNA polymerase sigma-70 factor (ECF subfamily)
MNPAVADEGQGDGGDDSRRLEAQDLALRAVRRDPGAWETIFESHYRAVFAFVRYRLSGAAEAEDIASQVFETAFARADRFDYRGIPIEAWLMGIARNLLRDHIKKRARRGPEEELHESSATEPDDSARIDLAQDITRAMRDLTEDQQTVLSLRFLLDRSVAETAALMERSEDAVKNLQRRALAAMQRSLTAAGYREGAP